MAKANQWNSGLFDCWDNKKDCCLSFWCFPFFACKTSKRVGENFFLPVFDSCGAIPAMALSMRVSMRHRYNIQGSIFDDCIHTACCCPCIYCQMSREMDIRGTP
ncbi:cornifelin-like protein b [Triplophysa rosa]|uniref:Cornifelin-like protein b n=1 Tax=Triplophysa rosa TaxID=992332 RepID=A0A9W7X4K7_TRIRA|nr:cornifelin-like protein b [Triplophysa rosa]